ncbi:TAP-like protein-domain-containing protein [Phaeosphaeria sp. MPI-PUGE-AT-0046c]|nr:TAP-like protein-domain-containing protein [Phaeosphaeria sp. MPI-PUGE-AT-0046c]
MKSWNNASDESAPLIAPARGRSAGDDRRGVRIRALAWTLATCMAIFGVHALYTGDRDGYLPPSWRPEGPKEKPFQWSQIDPSEKLEFHKCYDDFECAKLSVPLNYYNGTHPDERASIAITKLPAQVPVDDERYGGPILLNPGGPGGPGAWFALWLGKNLQTIVDAEAHPGLKPSDMRYFDIMGFDPRGIGWTEPAAHCMDHASTWSWTLRETTEGILGSSDAALGRLWSMSQAWGASCKQSVDAEDGPDIKQYMSTGLVARDMLEIVEKHATWVAETLTRRGQGRGRTVHHPDVSLWKPQEAKLQYWGFSYGTQLGATFSSMFPDRVGRVVLDGVVSSYDYNHSLGNGSLTDNAKVMKSFYTYCVNAGPEACPLTTANSTSDDVKDRVDDILESLYHNPLALSSPLGPDILTYSDVKGMLFSAGYAPIASYPFAFAVLAAIEAGHGPVLDMLQSAYRVAHIYSCPVPGSKPDSSIPEIPDADSVPLFAFLCNDGVDATHMTIDDFAAYWKQLEAVSPSAGAVWSSLMMRCTSWKIKPAYKYTGAYGGNTSHPILYLSNTADPVTPLRSARIMHGKFLNSGLLVSDQAGHCSGIQPNMCVLNHVKMYFQTGMLPQENTLCVPPLSPYSLNSTDPESPFYDPSLEGMRIEEAVSGSEVGGSQGEMYQAAWEVARQMAGQDWFGMGGMVSGGKKAMKFMRLAAAEMEVL